MPQGISHGDGKELLKCPAVLRESWASGNLRQGCLEELGLLSIEFLSGIPMVPFVF